MIAERGAGAGEQLLEHLAHREHGRPGVDFSPVDLEFAQLSARRQGAFDDERVQTVRGSEHGGGETADSRPNHDDAPLSHAACPPTITKRIDATRKNVNLK